MGISNVRLRLVLTPTEWCALCKLAEMETRDLNSQIRHILRMELRARGLLANGEMWESGDDGEDED